MRLTRVRRAVLLVGAAASAGLSTLVTVTFADAGVQQHAAVQGSSGCGTPLRADGKISFVQAQQSTGNDLAYMMALQVLCAPARFPGSMRPKFAAYIDASAGNLKAKMPKGTPYYTTIGCIDGGCP